MHMTDILWEGQGLLLSSHVQRTAKEVENTLTSEASTSEKKNTTDPLSSFN